MKPPKEKCFFGEAVANEVVPSVWLGCKDAALDTDFLHKKNIGYIIRIIGDFPPEEHIRGINYLYYPINNNTGFDKDLTHIFEDSINFINNAIANKKSVLVHCQKGHHRSASIVAAYLIKKYNLNYLTSIAYLNYLRPCAMRRKTSMTIALFKWYNKLIGTSCTNFFCSKKHRMLICNCTDLY
jgi:hypothetical protein